MSEQFSGFTKKSLKFFSDLQKNNSKGWFNENRNLFDSEILIPAKAFVTAMGDKLRKISPDIVADPRTDKSIFRIYRDIRFSKEKIPYKTHLGIYFWEGAGKKLENPGFYFHFDKDSVFIGVGMHIFPKQMLTAYRDAVVDPKKGEKLEKAIKDVSKNNTEYSLGWKQYKQTPRGYDKDHPRADYLLYGGIGFHYKSEIPGEFYSNKLLDYTYKIFKDMSPIHFWIKNIS
jgi:uncharacterized protein (TIGR02453 family)